MTSDWVDGIKDNAVNQVAGIATLELSLHSAEPDLSNPAANELGIVSRTTISAADWAAAVTSTIYRQRSNSLQLSFGVSTGSATATWLTIWDATGGTPSTTPVGKIQLDTAEPIALGANVIIPIGNLIIRAAGVAA